MKFKDYINEATDPKKTLYVCDKCDLRWWGNELKKGKCPKCGDKVRKFPPRKKK